MNDGDMCPLNLKTKNIKILNVKRFCKTKKQKEKHKFIKWDQSKEEKRTMKK